MRVAARIRDMVEKNPRPWATACVFFVAILIYLPTLRYGFIGYDDTLLVVNNQAFLSDLSNVPRAFTQDAFQVPGYNSSNAYYRPIMTLSLMVDATLGKAAPFVYHLDNVLEHGVASCLVLALLAGLGYSLLASLLLALFFAVHPIFVGVVAWVPGRVDSLMSIFAFASILGLIAYVQRGGRGRYAWHIVAFAIAAFTKEVGVFLPIPMVVGLLAAREGKFDRRKLRSLIPGYVAVIAAWFFLRRTAVTAPQPLGELLSNLAHNLVILLHYLGKALIPVHLSVAPTIPDTPIVPGIAALVLLTATIIFSGRRRVRFIVLGIVWFLVFAVPSLLVPRFVGLEQRLYLPMVGILVLILESAARGFIERPRYGVAIAACVIALFAGISIHHASVYRSRLAFWESAVATSPHSSYARGSLGAVYMSRNRVEDARAQYLRALELNPIEPKVNGNLGVIAAREGHRDEARTYFMKEITVNPDYPDAYFNLGQSYAESGDYSNAVKMWERTVEVRPDHREALLSLARYYTAQGQSDRAAEYIRRLGAHNTPK
jgi:tetratricopeptide (TPR) repeat protein